MLPSITHLNLWVEFLNILYMQGKKKYVLIKHFTLEICHSKELCRFIIIFKIKTRIFFFSFLLSELFIKSHSWDIYFHLCRLEGRLGIILANSEKVICVIYVCQKILLSTTCLLQKIFKLLRAKECISKKYFVC